MENERHAYPYHKNGKNLKEQLKSIDQKKSKKHKAIIAFLSATGILAVSIIAFVMYNVYDFNNNLNRSDILSGGSSDINEEQNILLMGLDSRIDQKGNPFPAEIYDALHAGNSEDGGYNSNVLMYIHIPKGGKQSQVISIPRDNYVNIYDSKGNTLEKGKIKEAYGIEVNRILQKLYGSDLSEDERYRTARDAGRKAQIETIENFLGNNIAINHFVEIDMAGFFTLAKAVEPITVCLNHPTKDIYSGADFPAGIQQISAEQSVAFVRQRRDYYNTEVQLTDLDRSRRQQAFIAAVMHNLKDIGTYTDIRKAQEISSSLTNHLTVDANMNIFSLAPKMLQVMQGNTKFTTLPIERFGTSYSGQSVNIVNIEAIQYLIQELIRPESITIPPNKDDYYPEENSDLNQNTPKENENLPNNPENNNDNSENTEEQDDTTTYETWEEPLLSNGSIPCVN